MGHRALAPGRARVHVMLCYSIYPPIQAGGAELVVSYLAEGLAQRGHRVTVVTTCGPEMEPYPDEQRNGCEVIRFFPPNRYWLFAREGRGGIDKLRWHLRDAWNPAAARRLDGLLRTRRPDVVHTHGIEGFSPAFWQCVRAHNIPLVHTAHDYYMICPRALLLTSRFALCNEPTMPCRLRRAWYLRCATTLDLFCSPSQFLLDEHRRAGLAARRFAVVPNGIPVVPQSPARQRTDSQSLHLLMASRLTPEKGVRVVLEAMRRLPGHLPVRVTIAGKGALESEVREACTQDPRIAFAGYVSGEEKARLFSEVDALLLPSLWYENAPIVVLEAAAYQLPLIASRLGAIPEFVEHGTNGLLFEPGNAQALADAIVRLSADRELRARLAQGGAPLIARHTIARMLDTYTGHYDQLLSTAEPRMGRRATRR
jgi:glycosyltransferase involved in cell wall biosynthesis